MKKKIIITALVLVSINNIYGECQDPEGAIREFRTSEGIHHHYVQMINGQWKQVERQTGGWRLVGKEYQATSNDPYELGRLHQHSEKRTEAAYDNYRKNGGKASYANFGKEEQK